MLHVLQIYQDGHGALKQLSSMHIKPPLPLAAKTEAQCGGWGVCGVASEKQGGT